jgi:hypothetical protein
MGTSDIFSDLIWLVPQTLEASCDQGSCPGTNPFRGPKFHSGADLAPLQGGDKYFPNKLSFNGTKFISLCILVVLQDIRMELGISLIRDQEVQLSKETGL